MLLILAAHVSQSTPPFQRSSPFLVAFKSNPTTADPSTLLLPVPASAQLLRLLLSTVRVFVARFAMAYSMAVQSCVLAVVMVLAVAPAAYAQSMCNTTLLQAVAANPNLAELAKIIQMSNLSNKLNMTDNVTVLAPNNAAFNGTGGLYQILQTNNVTLQQVTGLASNSENRAGSIILYHIIPVPAVTAAQLVNGENLPTSLSGYNLTVSKTNPTPTTTSVTFIGNATNATVVTADMRVCNSVVHIVNHVLLPSGNLTAIPVYDNKAPTPGVGTSAASGLAIGTWAFALSGALAAASMM